MGRAPRDEGMGPWRRLEANERWSKAERPPSVKGTGPVNAFPDKSSRSSVGERPARSSGIGPDRLLEERSRSARRRRLERLPGRRLPRSPRPASWTDTTAPSPSQEIPHHAHGSSSLAASDVQLSEGSHPGDAELAPPDAELAPPACLIPPANSRSADMSALLSFDAAAAMTRWRESV